MISSPIKRRLRAPGAGPFCFSRSQAWAPERAEGVPVRLSVCNLKSFWGNGVRGKPLLANKKGLSPRSLIFFSAQHFLDQLVEQLGIGLAFCLLHDLAHEKAHELLVAGLEFFHLVRVGVEDGLENAFQFAGVGYLF